MRDTAGTFDQEDALPRVPLPALENSCEQVRTAAAAFTASAADTASSVVSFERFGGGRAVVQSCGPPTPTGPSGTRRVDRRCGGRERSLFCRLPAFTLRPAGRRRDTQQILLTDHQAVRNSPADLHFAAQPLGDINAVPFADDPVSIPVAGSEG